jgi:serine/threonine protein phosphatase PrpC
MALVSRVNDEVNRMLGPNELYKCGSTIVAALVEPDQFQWISVGDSRIYLYRGGLLLQLNREHNYEADLLLRAVNHQGSFQEAKGNPKRKSVSSFIGMGTLRYVDEAQRPTRSLKGDRILICSDGVFNTLPEQQIEKILEENPDPNTAAEKLKVAVLQANNPHQDNFTAVIIAYE